MSTSANKECHLLLIRTMAISTFWKWDQMYHSFFIAKSPTILARARGWSPLTSWTMPLYWLYYGEWCTSWHTYAFPLSTRYKSEVGWNECSTNKVFQGIWYRPGQSNHSKHVFAHHCCKVAAESTVNKMHCSYMSRSSNSTSQTHNLHHQGHRL